MNPPHRLTSLLTPPRCIACARATAPAEGMCRRCSAALTAARPGTETIAAGGDRLTVSWACEYAGVARDLIHALKFSHRLHAARPIAAAMAPLIPPDASLVPVPAAAWRRRVRGFDPAEVIALELARQSGRDLVQCLRRRRGRRQVGRSRADRLAAPPGVRLVGRPPAEPVLIDDVFTTGATLAACAAALDGKAIAATVFARTARPGCARA